jgi:hypothetical protein
MAAESQASHHELVLRASPASSFNQGQVKEDDLEHKINITIVLTSEILGT